MTEPQDIKDSKMRTSMKWKRDSLPQNQQHHVLKMAATAATSVEKDLHVMAPLEVSVAWKEGERM